MKSRSEPGSKKLRSGRNRPFIVRLYREKPLSGIGLTLMIIFVLCAIFADVIAPTKMSGGILPSSLSERLDPPSLAHLLGTDTLGRDMLSYMIYGARTSVILAVSCTIISTAISVVIGVSSAVIGGWYDLLIQRIVDAWMSIPNLLITLILMSMLGNGILQLIFVLSVPAGIAGTRLIRSAAYQVKDMDYVNMATMLGARKLWNMVKHVIPNTMPMVLMSLAAGIGGTIMNEASLSFLGFGVAANTPDWGAILTSSGRSNMYMAPWLALVPGIAISLVVFASAMFSDGVRDLLDPRLRGGASSYKQKKKKKSKANTQIPKQEDSES